MSEKKEEKEIIAKNEAVENKTKESKQKYQVKIKKK